MDEIPADGVEPAFCPALGEEVILTLVIEETIEVVDPTFLSHARI